MNPMSNYICNSCPAANAEKHASDNKHAERQENFLPSMQFVQPIDGELYNQRNHCEFYCSCLQTDEDVSKLHEILKLSADFMAVLNYKYNGTIEGAGHLHNSLLAVTTAIQQFLIEMDTLRLKETVAVSHILRDDFHQRYEDRKTTAKGPLVSSWDCENISCANLITDGNNRVIGITCERGRLCRNDPTLI